MQSTNRACTNNNTQASSGKFSLSNNSKRICLDSSTLSALKKMICGA